jgi:predicted Fe-Mo cluster-binding NifX family protein
MGSMNIKMRKGKIAVPSMGETLDSLICDNFGRCPFLIFYDKESKKYYALENTGSRLQDGSGLKAAELIIKNNADILLTIELGRKAYSALSREHIDIHLINYSGSVKSAINKFLKN